MHEERLFLTRLDYDRNNDQGVAIATWCLPRDQAIDFVETNHEVLEYTAGQRSSLIRANVKVSTAYIRLIPVLTSIMNRYHGTNYSQRYWKILVGFWFRQYLDNLFERHEVLLNAKKLVPKGCVLLIPPNREWIAKDTDEYSVGLFSDRLNHQLFGQIIRARQMFHFSDDDSLASSEVDSNLGRRSKSFERLKRWVFIVNCWMVKLNYVVLLNTHLNFGLLKKISLRYVSIPLLGTPRLSSKSIEHDWDSRGIMSEELTHSLTDFESLAIELLPRNIPEAFCERYSELIKIASWLKPLRARLFITANAFAAQEVYKTWVGWAAEDSISHHVILQHGANYGQSEVMSDEEFETGTADSYITSGWSDSERPLIDKFVGLSFMTGINSYREILPNYNPEGSIIWVLASLPRYHYTQWSAPQGPKFKFYLDEQVAFLCHLQIEPRENILCRGYLYDYGWGDLEYIAHHSGEFQIDRERKPLRQMIKSAMLTVYSYNSTAMMESMVMNLPTLCYWNPELWEWRKDAKPLLHILNKVGIYHESGEDAANFINKKLEENNLMVWWFSEDVQSARRAYCDQYANVRGDVGKRWLQRIDEWSSLYD
jgi:putative transferase (TIGR04331 family)